MSDLRSTLAHALNDELDAAFGRIVHCVNQLSEAQVWWRPTADMNSIANLVLHLTGNVRQFIGSIVGGEPDTRDRPAEFSARESSPKAELIRKLTDAVHHAHATLATASEEELCRVRRVRDQDWTGLQAVIRSVAHFRGHAQEIIHQTREILGEKYQFAGPK